MATSVALHSMARFLAAFVWPLRKRSLSKPPPPTTPTPAPLGALLINSHRLRPSTGRRGHRSIGSPAQWPTTAQWPPCISGLEARPASTLPPETERERERDEGRQVTRPAAVRQGRAQVDDTRRRVTFRPKTDADPPTPFSRSPSAASWPMRRRCHNLWHRPKSNTGLFWNLHNSSLFLHHFLLRPLVPKNNNKPHRLGTVLFHVLPSFTGFHRPGGAW